MLKASVRMVTAVAAIAMAGLLLQMVAQSQTMSTKTTVTNSSPQEEIKVLRQQLLALTDRVHELEKKADEAQNNSDEDPQAKKIEHRLTTVEHAQAKLEAELAQGNKKEGPEGTEGLTVTAPFTVVDDSGKPLMRVQADDGSFSRGMYVFDDGGHSVAHVGSWAKGGRIYVNTPASLPSGMLAADTTGPIFKLASNSKPFVLIDKQSISFYGDNGGPALALFGSKNRSKGYMELNDSGGNKMVEAGSLDSHKGYVLASPYQASVEPHGDPSVLKGAGK